MLPAEITRPAVAATTAPPAAPPPADARTLGAQLSARALTDPVGAAAAYRAALPALSPLQQGELARSAPVAASFAALDFDIPGIPDIPNPFDLDLPAIPTFPNLPGLPGLPDLPNLPGLPDIDIPSPIDILKGGLERAGDALERLKAGAEAVKETLEKLPHELADKLADSMRGDKARVLTDAEKQAFREAFGNRVNIDDVRFVDGPGNSPLARAAFAKGNPAITIGDTVYFKPGHFSTDFAATAEGRNTLIHELTHVVQYQELGYARFGAKYAADLARVGGDPDELYRYEKRDTVYATETLEGQAQMVGDYAQLRTSTNPADQAKIADLERRLAGTGIYGL